MICNREGGGFESMKEGALLQDLQFVEWANVLCILGIKNNLSPVGIPFLHGVNCFFPDH